MLAQLHTVFARMSSPLILRLYLDETPLSAELKQYMEELAAQSSKLTAEIGTAEEMEHLPCVRVCRPDGSWTGLAFHGVPAATSSPPITMYLRFKARQPAVSFSASLPKLLE